jgi:hypothetical protein
MKNLIYFLENHSINFKCIIQDTSLIVSIILLIGCIAMFYVIKIIVSELVETRNSLSFAEEKVEDKLAELFAANHIKDCLTVENSVLKQKLEIAEEKLAKFNFPRDSKGHFISKKLKIAENEYN